ncbi:MAG TPA: hypothetical protein VM260_07580, partial [Pirellula sp.]|nr:hypothetical protein [Pirellula sp.]
MTIPNHDNGNTDCGIDLVDDGWLSGCSAGPGPGDTGDTTGSGESSCDGGSGATGSGSARPADTEEPGESSCDGGSCDGGSCAAPVEDQMSEFVPEVYGSGKIDLATGAVKFAV